jgi:uncharacterized membrane protein YdjX (TVP38/TMEM64 family)
MSLRARLALLAAVLLALFVVFGVLQVVSRDDVQGWIDPLGGWGAPVFALLSAVLGCLLVPGPLLAAASGVLFGTWVGFLVTLSSAVLAALMGWAVGKAVGEVDWRYRDLLQRRGLWAVVVQRLLPGVPDAPVNYLAGVAGVRAWHLALGTAIGVAPRAFAYTALGDAIGDRSTAQTVAALALLGVTAIAGLIVAKRAVSTSGGPPPPADRTFANPRSTGRRRHP